MDKYRYPSPQKMSPKYFCDPLNCCSCGNMKLKFVDLSEVLHLLKGLSRHVAQTLPQDEL